MTDHGDTYRSMMLVFGGTALARVLQFGGSIAVARMLEPSELGQFVLATAVLGIVEITAQSGLVQALIQSRKQDERTWQSVWNFLVLRSIVAAALLYLLAEPIARLFRAPDIAPLLQAVAFVPVLTSLQSLSLVRRQRGVDFGPIARLAVATQVVNTVTSVAAVALTRSAWGLVIGLLVGTAFQALASYLVPGFRPGTSFSLRALTGLFRFGRWRFLSFALWWLGTQADDLIVGRSLGTQSLGLYRVAFRLAQVPTTEVTDVAVQVMFPAFARSHRTSESQAKALFHRYLLVTAGVSALLAALLAGAAGPIIHVLVGAAYAGAVTPLVVMSAAGFLRGVTATGGALFAGAGRPVYDTLMQAFRACVLVGSILLLVRYGVTGAATASLCSVVAIIPPWLFGLSRLGIRPLGAVLTVLRRVPAAACAGTAAALVGPLAGQGLTALVAAVTAGLAVWTIVAVLVDRPFVDELLRMFRRVRRRRPGSMPPPLGVGAPALEREGIA
jgi:O-antigen/teichoic acid export membrane protein